MPIPGAGELLIILIIVLIIFGGGKIAGVGKSMGTAIKEFKDAVSNKDKDETALKSIGQNQSDKAPASEGAPAPAEENREEHHVV